MTLSDDNLGGMDRALHFATSLVMNTYLAKIMNELGSAATTGFLLRELADALSGLPEPDEVTLQQHIDEAWITLAGPSLSAFKTWLLESYPNSPDRADFLQRYEQLIEERRLKIGRAHV